MLGDGIEMVLISRQTLGSLVLGWAPNHFVLGAQLAPGRKRLVCIPAGSTYHIVGNLMSGLIYHSINGDNI